MNNIYRKRISNQLDSLLIQQFHNEGRKVTICPIGAAKNSKNFGKRAGYAHGVRWFL